MSLSFLIIMQIFEKEENAYVGPLINLFYFYLLLNKNVTNTNTEQ